MTVDPVKNLGETLIPFSNHVLSGFIPGRGGGGILEEGGFHIFTWLCLLLVSLPYKVCTIQDRYLEIDCRDQYGFLLMLAEKKTNLYYSL